MWKRERADESVFLNGRAFFFLFSSIASSAEKEKSSALCSLSLFRPLSRALLLSDYYHFTGNPNGLAQDLARYTSLTPAAVHETARKTLTLDKYVRIDIVPEGKAPAGGTP